jgi:hypothetical protein
VVRYIRASKAIGIGALTHPRALSPSDPPIHQRFAITQGLNFQGSGGYEASLPRFALGYNPPEWLYLSLLNSQESNRDTCLV